MNYIFDNYKTDKDKFESLYIFVIYDLTIDEFNNKIEKVMKILDNITDSKKRGFLKNRIYNFHKYISDFKDDNFYLDGIYFVSDKINKEKLTQENKNVLKFFNHPNFCYNYGNNYPIDWLINLINDIEYVNVFNIKNNDIKYFILNETKKKYIYQDTIKSMDIKTIINNNILKNKENKIEKYFLYGSSVNLKTFQDPNCFNIINTNKEILDEDILNYYKMDKYKKNNDELKDILDKITTPKIINKIVFGNDNLQELENNMIDTIFVSDNNILLKEIQNYNANIKIVKSFSKGDIIDNFINNYGGIIGLKYF